MHNLHVYRKHFPALEISFPKFSNDFMYIGQFIQHNEKYLKWTTRCIIVKYSNNLTRFFKTFYFKIIIDLYEVTNIVHRAPVLLLH